jgi:hypothetical protein
VRPQDVTSPKDRWVLDRVLIDGPASGKWWSLALGRWRGPSDEWRKCLAIRWDGGTAEDPNEKGMPISSGYAVWFILPEELYPFLVAAIPAENRQFVLSVLGDTTVASLKQPLSSSKN